MSSFCDGPKSPALRWPCGRRISVPLDDDRAGAAVVADRQVAPVRRQRLLIRPEHPPHVRRVLERRVEVDVVGDRRTAAATAPPRQAPRGHVPGPGPSDRTEVARAQIDHDVALDAGRRAARPPPDGEDAELHRIPSARSSPTGSLERARADRREEVTPHARSTPRRSAARPFGAEGLGVELDVTRRRASPPRRRRRTPRAGSGSRARRSSASA